MDDLSVGKCLALKYVCGTAGLIVLFWLALSLVYCIPFSCLQFNLEESVEILESEGEYPNSYIRDGELDNYTAAIMLNEASQCAGNPFIESLRSNYHIGEDNQVSNLRAGLTAEPNGSYETYWHGYLLLLKPLLMFFNLQEIRLIFQTIFLVLLGITCVSLYRIGKKAGIAFAIVLCLSMGFIGCTDATATLPIFFSFAVALAMMIVVSRIPLDSMLLEKGGIAQRVSAVFDSSCVYAFFIAGAVTVFFDFLDNPLITLGLPLIVLIIRLPSKTPFSRMFLVCCACCIVWLFGYGLIWLGKWALASIVLGENIISSAFERVAFRAGASEEGRVYGSNTMVFALGLNVLKLGKVMWLLFLEAAIALISLAVVVALRKRACGAVELTKRLGLLAMVCLLPYVWYALAANHSVIHAQNIAYRTQAVTLFALSVAIVLVVHWIAEQKRDRA